MAVVVPCAVVEVPHLVPGAGGVHDQVGVEREIVVEPYVAVRAGPRAALSFSGCARRARSGTLPSVDFCALLHRDLPDVLCFFCFCLGAQSQLCLSRDELTPEHCVFWEVPHRAGPQAEPAVPENVDRLRAGLRFKGISRKTETACSVGSPGTSPAGRRCYGMSCSRVFLFRGPTVDQRPAHLTGERKKRLPLRGRGGGCAGVSKSIGGFGAAATRLASHRIQRSGSHSLPVARHGHSSAPPQAADLCRFRHRHPFHRISPREKSETCPQKAVHNLRPG